MRRALGWLFAILLLAGVPAVAFADDGSQDTQTETVEVAAEGDNTIDPSAPAVGSTHEVDGSTYRITSNDPKSVSFVKSRNAGSVVVPDAVSIGGETYTVTEIGPKAFASAKKMLTKVKVGKNVAIIGTSAFAGCKKLVKVTGGAAVTIIMNKAFLGCKKLKKCAPFSSKVLVKVGKDAFKGTKKLKKLTVKSQLLKKKAVKGSLAGSSVKIIKVKAGAKKYKRAFAKKNSGKKVVVR